MSISVRTTVTLEADVLERAKRFSAERSLSFREGLNELVRLGLIAEESHANKTFEIKPRRMGLLPGLSYDNVEELLEVGEGSQHR
jgi:hypothetical protein